MKKIVKSLLTVWLAVFMTVALTGCNKDGSSNSTATIAGTYDLETITLSGEEPMSAEETGRTGKLTLNEDGTGVFEVTGYGVTNSMELTYSMDSMLIKSEGYEDSFTYKDGVLEWTLDDLVYTFKKSK